MRRLGSILIVMGALTPGAVSRGDDGPGAPTRTAAEWVAVLAQGDPSGRAQAARALGQSGTLPDDAKTALVAALNDADPTVRARAAVALARHKGPLESVLPALLAARRVDDPNVRAEARAAWGRIGPGVRAAMPYLRQQYTGPNAASVRRIPRPPDSQPGPGTRAATTLERAGLEAVPALIDELATATLYTNSNPMVISEFTKGVRIIGSGNPSSPQFRTFLVEGLVKIGRSAEPTLVEALANRRALVRDGATEALGKMGGLSDVARVALIRALDDREPSVRQKAIDGFAQVPPESPDIGRALVVAVGHKDPYVRRGAIPAIRRIRPVPEGAVAALNAAVDDPDPTVRLRAAEALIDLEPGSRRPLLALVEALEDRDPTIRQGAVAALGRLGARMAEVESVLAEHTTSDDPDVRLAAAVTLGQAGPAARERAIAVLRELLGAVDPAIRLTAAEALWSLGQSAEALPVLLASLAVPTPAVSNQAIQVLNRVSPIPKELVPQLVEVLDQATPQAKASVLSILQRMGPPAREALPAIARLVGNRDGNVRQTALNLLRQAGRLPDEILPSLLDAMKNADPYARIEVIGLLGRSASQSMVVTKALIEMIKDPDHNVQVRAISAVRDLNNLGDDAVAEALVRAVEDGDDGLRVQVLQILGQSGARSNAAVPLLLKMLRSPRPEMRLQAIQAVLLGQVRVPGEPEALIAGLVAAMRDADPRVRDQAGTALVRGFGTRGVEAALPSLTGALRGTDPDARAQALRAIPSMLAPAPDLIRPLLPKVLEATEDPAPAVRAPAVAALRQMGETAPDRLHAIVARALRDDAPAVRIEAAQALVDRPGVVADGDAVATLVGLLEGPPPEIRVRAVRLLGSLGPRGEASLPALVRLLGDGKPEVRGNAALTLYRMGPAGRQAGRDAVLRLIREDDSILRSYAFAALREVGEADADAVVPGLIQALGSADQNQSYPIIQILGSYHAKARPAIPALVALLDGNHFGLQSSTIQALRQIGPEGSKALVPLALSALQGTDQAARLRVFQFLPQLDPTALADLIPALVPLLNDPQLSTRQMAARLLPRIGPDGVRAARPAMLAMLKDPEFATRVAAAGVLADLGDEDNAACREALREGVVDPGKPTGVRVQAAGILARIDDEGQRIATPVLREALRGNRDERHQAITTLMEVELPPTDVIVSVLVELLDSGDPFSRTQANELITRIPRPTRDVISVLQRALNTEPRNQTVSLALQALTRFGAEGVPAIVAAIPTAEGPRQLALIRALGRIGPPAREAIPTLVNLLCLDNEANRVAAAESLAAIGPDASGALAQIAAKVSDPPLRRSAAARALVTFRSSARAVEPVLHGALADPDPDVRGSVAAAVLAIRGWADAPEDLGKRVETSLREGDRETRRAAALALAQAGPVPVAMGDALAAATRDQDGPLRLRAAEALAKVPGREPEGVRVLIEAVGNRNLAATAIDALDHLGPAAHDAIPALAAVLDLQEFNHDIIRAAHTLAVVGGKDAVEPLRRAVGRAHRPYRALIINTLAQADATGVDRLPEFVDHDDPAVRTMTMRLIGEHAGDREPFRAILHRALEDGNPGVRNLAIQGVSTLGSIGAEFVPQLTGLLGHPAPSTRAEAAIALAKVEGKATGPVLEILRKESPRRGLPAQTDTLSDRSASILSDRWRVVEVLGRAGPAAIRELTRALMTDDHSRLKAAEALGRIGPDARSAAPALEAAIHGLPWATRARAAVTLARIAPESTTPLPVLVDALRAPALNPRENSPFIPVFLGDQSAIRRYHSDSDSEANPNLFTIYPTGTTQFLPVVSLVSLRRDIVAALGQMGPRAASATDTLAAIARDGDDPAREAAAEALSRIDPKAAAAPAEPSNNTR